MYLYEIKERVCVFDSYKTLVFATRLIHVSNKWYQSEGSVHGEYDATTNPKVDGYKLWELEYPNEGVTRFLR